MRTLSLLALAVCSGCITTTTLRPGQLTKLEGYDAAAVTQPTRTLETSDGEQVEFTSNKVVRFEVKGEAKGDAPVKGLLQHFELDARTAQVSGTFVGGQKFTFDPSSLTATKLSWVSGGKTALFIVGLIAGTIATFAAGAGLVVLGGRPLISIGGL